MLTSPLGMFHIEAVRLSKRPVWPLRPRPHTHTHARTLAITRNLFERPHAEQGDSGGHWSISGQYKECQRVTPNDVWRIAERGRNGGSWYNYARSIDGRVRILMGSLSGDCGLLQLRTNGTGEDNDDGDDASTFNLHGSIYSLQS